MGTAPVRRTESVQELLDRLDELEHRVSRLEQREDSHRSADLEAAPFTAMPAQRPAMATPQPDPQSAPEGGSVFVSLAKAVLGFAGAYLLRAGAESGLLPYSVGILAAFAYALAWIVAAGRTGNRYQAASTVYALVSAIIFLPLLWENAVQSALLPPPIAACLIVVYLCAGQVVAWLRDRREIAAITAGSAVAASIVLHVATRDLIAFSLSLLCAAALSEIAACRGRWLNQRWIAALGADFAVLTTAWIWSHTLPQGYPPFSQATLLAIQLALVLVYLASTGYRTLILRNIAVPFEICQNVTAIGLFILGQIAMAPAGSQRFMAGVICAVIALGSYAASIPQTHRGARRNSVLYEIFGLALVGAAIPVLVPPGSQVFVWCILGAGAAWFGVRDHLATLRWQAPVYVFGALVASGLVQTSARSLGSLAVPRADQLIAMLITTAAAVLAYSWAGSDRDGNRRVPPLLCAALLLSSVLGLSAIAVKSTVGGLSFATSLRVGLLCLAAIGSAAWGRSRWSHVHRPEWVWLSYPLMAYGAWRILIEDLPSGRPAVASLSLLLYGVTLLLLTRILRPGPTAHVDQR